MDICTIYACFDMCIMQKKERCVWRAFRILIGSSSWVFLYCFSIIFIISMKMECSFLLCVYSFCFSFVFGYYSFIIRSYSCIFLFYSLEIAIRLSVFPLLARFFGGFLRIWGTYLCSFLFVLRFSLYFFW